MRTVDVLPAADAARRRPLVTAGLLASGLTAIMLFGAGFGELAAPAMLALVAVAALGLGMGLALALRIASGDPMRRLESELVAVLEPIFDDTYVLLLGPQIPNAPRGLAAILVGPAGIRVLTLRGWSGRYRVRGRHWEFDAGGARGWITCRTNPSREVVSLADAVARWARANDLDQNLPIAGAVVFPRPHSTIVLEEPDGEIVTADNAPWWARRIGRVQRIDALRAARFIEAVVAASRRSRSPAAAARSTEAV